MIYNRIWTPLLLLFQCRDELKIWQTSDSLGNTWWHAYNPTTGRSATRESEVEILAWIDQRPLHE